MELPEHIVELISDLTSEGDCWYDHHGYCQEHMWFYDDVVCPHKRAKELNTDLVTVRFQAHLTPVLQVDEDGEWRINIGDNRGKKNVLNYDIFNPDEGQEEFWLVKK
jgi:hypothetical protein